MIVTVYAANGGEQELLAAKLSKDPRVLQVKECDFRDVDAVLVTLEERYLERVMWEYGMVWNTDRQQFYRDLTAGWSR